jgi:hypothetical protein
MFGFKRAKSEAFSDVLDQMGPSVHESELDEATGDAHMAPAPVVQSQDWLLQLLTGMTPQDDGKEIPATPPIFEASYHEEDVHLEEAVAPLLEAIANCEQDAIAEELGLHQNLSASELKSLRRAFARENHPDRLHPSKREIATHRMTIANMLIDRELRQKPAAR